MQSRPLTDDAELYIDPALLALSCYRILQPPASIARNVPRDTQAKPLGPLIAPDNRFHDSKIAAAEVVQPAVTSTPKNRFDRHRSLPLTPPGNQAHLPRKHHAQALPSSSIQAISPPIYLTTPSPTPPPAPRLTPVSPPRPVIMRPWMTPVHADITLMHVAITAEEILTFFPNHTIWHLCTNRLINNGWTRNGVVAYKNYARSLTGEQGFLPTTFAGQITTADKAIYGKHQKKGESVRTPVDDLTPSWWASNPNSAPQNKVDYELAALAKGVVNWPQGPGRGPLTDCVEYACQQAEVVAFRISDVDEMTRDMDFNTIHAPSGHLDGNAARRHEKILNDLKWKDPRNELGKERDRRKRKRDSETPNGEQQDQGRQQKSRKKIPLHDRLQPQEKILTFK